MIGQYEEPNACTREGCGHHQLAHEEAPVRVSVAAGRRKRHRETACLFSDCECVGYQQPEGEHGG